MVDIGIVLAAIAIALTAIGMASVLIVWIVRASNKPLETTVKLMKEDMIVVEKTLAKLVSKVKSEEELKLMVDARITSHEKECRHFRMTETGTFRVPSPPHPAQGGD